MPKITLSIIVLALCMNVGHAAWAYSTSPQMSGINIKYRGHVGGDPRDGKERLRILLETIKTLKQDKRAQYGYACSNMYIGYLIFSISVFMLSLVREGFNPFYAPIVIVLGTGVMWFTGWFTYFAYAIKSDKEYYEDLTRELETLLNSYAPVV